MQAAVLGNHLSGLKKISNKLILLSIWFEILIIVHKNSIILQIPCAN